MISDADGKRFFGWMKDGDGGLTSSLTCCGGYGWAKAGSKWNFGSLLFAGAVGFGGGAGIVAVRAVFAEWSCSPFFGVPGVGCMAGLIAKPLAVGVGDWLIAVHPLDFVESGRTTLFADIGCWLAWVKAGGATAREPGSNIVPSQSSSALVVGSSHIVIGSLFRLVSHVPSSCMEGWPLMLALPGRIESARQIETSPQLPCTFSSSSNRPGRICPADIASFKGVSPEESESGSESSFSDLSSTSSYKDGSTVSRCLRFGRELNASMS